VNENTLVTPAHEAVTDADRVWFEARPHRRFRLRPLDLDELLPGEVIEPGLCVLVIRLGSPLVRLRVRVLRPPLRLRQNTDRCCRELVRLLDASGHTINGEPIGVLVEELSRDIATTLDRLVSPNRRSV
jgi:hypothetical protein